MVAPTSRSWGIVLAVTRQERPGLAGTEAAAHESEQKAHPCLRGAPQPGQGAADAASGTGLANNLVWPDGTSQTKCVQGVGSLQAQCGLESTGEHSEPSTPPRWTWSRSSPRRCPVR
jgi:hypothetical protein